jgi:hypothetical protein
MQGLKLTTLSVFEYLLDVPVASACMRADNGGGLVLLLGLLYPVAICMISVIYTDIPAARGSDASLRWTDMSYSRTIF